MKDWLKRFTHNVIVHPLMMLLPSELGTRLHDYNATWVFGLNRYDELKLEQPEQKPLPTYLVDDLAKISISNDMFDYGLVARAIKKAHGIGNR